MKHQVSLMVLSTVAVLLLNGATWKPRNAVAMKPQDPSLRIFGVGFPASARRPPGSELMELPVSMSEDGRHARFRLTVSVRNYGTASARYKLHLIAAGRRAAASPTYEVAKAAVRREPYEVDLDFATASGAGASGSPALAVVLPPNPVRAELLLLDQDGRELGRSAFNLVLSPFARPNPPVTHRTDLRVENARLIFSPGRNQGIIRIRPSVRAFADIRNVGTETWGFRGEVAFHLQMGTPETRLEDLGEPGMPTYRSVPLPTGLSPTGAQAVSTVLETRIRVSPPGFASRILEVIPPLRPGVWYTLTVSCASEADLDPSNNAERYVFMLNDDMRLRESRTVRVTDYIRVLTR